MASQPIDEGGQSPGAPRSKGPQVLVVKICVTKLSQTRILTSDTLTLSGECYDNNDIINSNVQLQPIKTWPIPRNRKQLKSFLGFTNYFRQHISHYAQIAFPLTELLSQAKPDKLGLQCGTSQQYAFDELREALMKRPILRPLDPSKTCELDKFANTKARAAKLM